VPLLTILLNVKKSQSRNFTYTTFTDSTKSSSDRTFFTHACSLDGKGLLNSEVHELAFSQLYHALYSQETDDDKYADMILETAI